MFNNNDNNNKDNNNKDKNINNQDIELIGGIFGQGLLEKK